MLQAIIKKGKVFAEKVPAPKLQDGQVLIQVYYSCISSGTELTSVSISGKSLFQKAKEKPEKIQKVINKLKTDGISKTISMVEGELNIGKSTGYSISGKVIEVGKNVDGIEVGEFVTGVGVDFANHAEIVSVPKNLISKIPKELNVKEASTAAIGAIAMQGVRRANLTLGESCVVYGTGVLGLLTIQMLRASGVRVIAIDLDQTKLELAKGFGAELTLSGDDDSVSNVINFTNGYGVDAVIFTAATKSSEPLSNSFKMCKRKGKVILVGVSGMEIKREDIYAKELDFQISTSYGPGRYDSNYELKGNDYPYSYVRWTEQRNIDEYLRLLSIKSIQLDKIITHEFDIKNVDKAFDTIQNPNEKSLLVLLKYDSDTNNNLSDCKIILNQNTFAKKDIFNVTIVGVGSFAKNTHLPNLLQLKDKFRIHSIMNRDGYKGKFLADHYKANYVTTNYDDILNDKEVDVILISTRHDSHAEYTLKALQKGKHVLVEKPLATNTEELQPIIDFYNSDAKIKPLLMVGFNRRFSKYINEIKKHSDKRINPLIINYRMNAGYVHQDHWVHENGGRIIGEACHIIDLITSLTNSKIESIFSESMTPKTNYFNKSDNKIITIKYEDGSVGNLLYFAVGSKLLNKEYMEVHFDEKSIIMDNYQSMKGFGVNVKSIKSEVGDKGHLDELEQFYNSLKSPDIKWPISFDELIQTTEATFQIEQF